MKRRRRKPVAVYFSPASDLRQQVLKLFEEKPKRAAKRAKNS